MNLQQRLHISEALANYMAGTSDTWLRAREKASESNSWFIPPFIEVAVANICREFLDPEKLKTWISNYRILDSRNHPKDVGIVMAGNIPMVGFHDMLSVFLSGHRAHIKLSSKDDVLIPEVLRFMKEIEPGIEEWILVKDQLKNCDAYIATGSNNSARYFEQYFSKYPNIIRRNRTSVAILEGDESPAELESLADDIQLYFGLGCRNITKIYVPKNYDFINLLEKLKKYDYLMDGHKYKNNYDYNLTILIMNKRYYMTNGSVLLVEEPSPFSPIGQVHYEYFTDRNSILAEIKPGGQGRYADVIQSIAGKSFLPFGQSQSPKLQDYADGVDTMAFLMNL